MSKESVEVNKILGILGNETRRRIIHLLAEEPHYFIQIAKELGISQQAILKHLELLESFGLISSYRKESDLSAPHRKYYHLNRSLYLSIEITKDNVNISLRNIENQHNINDSSENTIIDYDLNSMVVNNERLSDLLKSSSSLLRKIDQRIVDLESQKVNLLEQKQNIIRKMHVAIRDNFDNILERSVLYSILASDSPLNIEFLSDKLDVREKEIERCVMALNKRLSIPVE